MAGKTHFATIIVLAAMLLALATVPAQADQDTVNDTNQTYNTSAIINSTVVNETETNSTAYDDSSTGADLINGTGNDSDCFAGTEIKQSIQDFVAASEEPVTADNIVSFVNGNAVGGAGEISFGSEYGSVSGNTITYGSEYVFNPASTDYISVSALDATHFVVAYQDDGNSKRGTAVIGSVSGNTITYGSEYVFNHIKTSHISVSALDATHFVVAYRDDGNSKHGTAVIGSVSGNTITYGSEYVCVSGLWKLKSWHRSNWQCLRQYHHLWLGVCL